MAQEQLHTKEANAHLISVGEALAAAKVQKETAFISTTLDDGRTYIKGDWEALHLSEQETLRTNSLQSVIDYLTANPDKLSHDQIIVHVTSATQVSVRSVPFGPFKQRTEYMRAEAVLPAHRFDSWTSPDIFVPYLQSCFCEGEDLGKLLACTGNMVATSEVGLKDDGVTQEVTLRQGVTRKAKDEVPNPLVLFPFSTFAEVMQPPRKFVFRIKSDPLNCTLIEADGGAWQLAALENIAEWLRGRLPEDVKVLA